MVEFFKSIKYLKLATLTSGHAGWFHQEVCPLRKVRESGDRSQGQIYHLLLSKTLDRQTQDMIDIRHNKLFLNKL